VEIVVFNIYLKECINTNICISHDSLSVKVFTALALLIRLLQTPGR